MDEIDLILKRFRIEFIDSASDRFDVLDTLTVKLATTTEKQPDVLEEIQRIIHGIKGEEQRLDFQPLPISPTPWKIIF